MTRYALTVIHKLTGREVHAVRGIAASSIVKERAAIRDQINPRIYRVNEQKED